MPPNANQSARMFTHHRLLFGRPRTSVQPGQAALRPRICYPRKTTRPPDDSMYYGRTAQDIDWPRYPTSGAADESGKAPAAMSV